MPSGSIGYEFPDQGVGSLAEDSLRTPGELSGRRRRDRRSVRGTGSWRCGRRESNLARDPLPSRHPEERRDSQLPMGHRSETHHPGLGTSASHEQSDKMTARGGGAVDTERTSRRRFLQAFGYAGATSIGWAARSQDAQALQHRDRAEPVTANTSWADVRRLFELRPDRIHMSGMVIASHPVPVARAIDLHRSELQKDPVRYIDENRWLSRATRCGRQVITSTQPQPTSH